MKPLRSIGPTLHVGAAAGAAGACAAAGADAGAESCAPARTAVAMAAPAKICSMRVGLDCIGTYPPEETDFLGYDELGPRRKYGIKLFVTCARVQDTRKPQAHTSF